jgi:hypothetical protein
MTPRLDSCCIIWIKMIKYHLANVCNIKAFLGLHNITTEAGPGLGDRISEAKKNRTIL